MGQSNNQAEEWLIPDFIRSIKYIGKKMKGEDKKKPEKKPPPPQEKKKEEPKKQEEHKKEETP